MDPASPRLRRAGQGPVAGGSNSRFETCLPAGRFAIREPTVFRYFGIPPIWQQIAPGEEFFRKSLQQLDKKPYWPYSIRLRFKPTSRLR
jgi:hypothetical protein